MAIRVQRCDNEIAVNLYHDEPADSIDQDQLSDNPSHYSQPGGDRGVGAAGSLQDPRGNITARHGGGQPEALVPRQQVSLNIPEIARTICDFSKVCV